MKERLFSQFSENRRLDGLDPLHVEWFRLGCEKAIKDNPGLSFEELLVACEGYLTSVRDIARIPGATPGWFS